MEAELSVQEITPRNEGSKLLRKQKIKKKKKAGKIIETILHEIKLADLTTHVIKREVSDNRK